MLEPALLTLADGLVRVLDAVVLRQPRRWETVGITTAVAASLTSRSVTMAHGTLRSPFKRLLEPVLDDE